MGGRGASRVISYYRDKHGRFTRYGEEYRCELEVGRIKFVYRQERNGFRDPPAPPMDTRTWGRIYVTIGKKDKLKTITFYDRQGHKKSQIDLDHPHKGEMPHKHLGYLQHRDGKMTKFDRWIIKYVTQLWEEHKND